MAEGDAPVDDLWVDDASLSKLKDTFFKEELFGPEPPEGYEQWVKFASNRSIEREYYKRGVLGTLWGSLDSKVEALLNGIGSRTRNALDLILKNKSQELYVNVKDFGAKGDGITDDTASIQSAVNYLEAEFPYNTGTLFFPKGTYLFLNAVRVNGGLNITGNGATLKKNSFSVSYVFFAGYSFNGKGYGAGANNILIEGLRIEGTFGANKRAACLLAIHHSDHVIVRNNTFSQAAGSGHRLDLQGCRFVYHYNNIHEGFDTSYGLLYNEDVQLDFSGARGGSINEVYPDSYDGLPTKHVHVYENQWLPLTLNGTTYPAPSPLGSHASIQYAWHDDIHFRNNVVIDAVQDTVQTLASGVLHFVAPGTLYIENNWIEDTTGTAGGSGAIKIYRASGGTAITDVADKNATSITYPVPQAFTYVKISGNVIKGFSSAGNSMYATGGASDSLGGTAVVENNWFIGQNADNGTSNTGALPFFSFIRKLVFKNNFSQNVRRVVESQNCLISDVESNIGINCYTNSITIFGEDASMLGKCTARVNKNRVTGGSHYGIYLKRLKYANVQANEVVQTLAYTGTGTPPRILLDNVRLADVNQNLVTFLNDGLVRGIEARETDTQVIKVKIKGNYMYGPTARATLPATSTSKIILEDNLADLVEA